MNTLQTSRAFIDEEVRTINFKFLSHAFSVAHSHILYIFLGLEGRYLPHIQIHIHTYTHTYTFSLFLYLSLICQFIYKMLKIICERFLVACINGLRMANIKILLIIRQYFLIIDITIFRNDKSRYSLLINFLNYYYYRN